MINYISADLIFPVSEPPIKNGIIGVDEEGNIQAIFTPAQAKHLNDIKHYNGVLVPGFINTHCHLELSHLSGKIEEKTGLTSFIKSILSNRAADDDVILTAMQKADEEMFLNGIVAVGDISNQLISRAVKLNSKIYYHTLVEVFGFNQPSAPIIAAGKKLKEDFQPLKASIVPHAPYSVSTELFNEIRKATTENDVLSIHNQETVAENELFEQGTGKFAEFFSNLGIAQSEAHNLQRNALAYHLPQLPKNINVLLVHNTFSGIADFNFAKTQHQNLYWCLCPNANLYIEGALPEVALFKKEELKITLGTDSLASNHELNILAEMQTLQDHKRISFEESLTWATLNGAEFLGINSQYGSLTVGKRPGINLIEITEGKIKKETRIKRIF